MLSFERLHVKMCAISTVRPISSSSLFSNSQEAHDYSRMK